MIIKMGDLKVAEYVWLDSQFKFRSKARTIEDKIPSWNYDGSSTGQATTKSSEIILKPKRIFKCLFRGDENLIALCDTYYPDGTPTKENTRHEANKLFKQSPETCPWFGLEQEFFIIDKNTGEPLDFDPTNPQGTHYCGVGHTSARAFMDHFYIMCLKMGIKMSGINAEVAPGQWEFQVGPCEGIIAGDHLLMARYVLERLAEYHNLEINYHPKHLEGNWNGSGCHANYSTLNMREGTKSKTGLAYIYDAIHKLEDNHDKHMKLYGVDNDKRMTGTCETSSYDKFTYNVGDRSSSVRIPTGCLSDKRGYFEDRRPASNCDPYTVTSILYETTVLNDN